MSRLIHVRNLLPLVDIGHHDTIIYANAIIARKSHFEFQKSPPDKIGRAHV